MTTLTMIFVALAAVCKAAVDTIVHHEGGKLRKWFGDFFDVRKQGKFLPMTEYPLDGLHVCNSLMILFFVLAISINLLEIGVMGVVFILIFNLFWNKIFN